MKEQNISDNKFYILLTIATLALVTGAVGLVVSLQRPAAQSTLPGGINTVERLPASGNMQTTEIDPSNGHGVAESPRKN